MPWQETICDLLLFCNPCTSSLSFSFPCSSHFLHLSATSILLHLTPLLFFIWDRLEGRQVWNAINSCTHAQTHKQTHLLFPKSIILEEDRTVFMDWTSTEKQFWQPMFLCQSLLQIPWMKHSCWQPLWSWSDTSELNNKQNPSLKQQMSLSYLHYQLLPPTPRKIVLLFLSR